MTDAVNAYSSAPTSRNRRSLRSIWQAGAPAVGGWCAIPSGLSAEAMARGGFDWVCIDMQHGCMDYPMALEMIRAVESAGCLVVVRVPWNEPGIIGRVLDAGADGVIIPMIQTASDARAAVDACLYPPAGRRSFGPMRVGLRDGASYFRDANDRILVIPMIETAEALADVHAIANTPGVGALFMGPSTCRWRSGYRQRTTTASRLLTRRWPPSWQPHSKLGSDLQCFLTPLFMKAVRLRAST